MQPLEEPYRVVDMGSAFMGFSLFRLKECNTVNGKYVDTSGNKLSCSIPPFSYLYPTNSISPREGSAFVCSVVHNRGTPDQYVEESLHGIAISAPITNTDTNYIGIFFLSNKSDVHTFISAEFVDMAGLRDAITEYLTTWTEWSSCSPYCKRSRFRVCSGEFKCYDDKDGVSELCTGKSWIIN